MLSFRYKKIYFKIYDFLSTYLYKIIMLIKDKLLSYYNVKTTNAHWCRVMRDKLYYVVKDVKAIQLIITIQLYKLGR